MDHVYRLTQGGQSPSVELLATFTLPHHTEEYLENLRKCYGPSVILLTTNSEGKIVRCLNCIG